MIPGFDTEGLMAPVWVGGESEALARLERHLERKAWVASFGRPKMTPQSLLPSQTGLSPYLRFGCLSTRLFYYQLTDLYKKVRLKFTTSSYGTDMVRRMKRSLQFTRWFCPFDRLKKPSHLFRCTVNCCGENFSTALRRRIQISTECTAIRFAFKYRGTRTSRHSQSGQT